MEDKDVASSIKGYFQGCCTCHYPTEWYNYNIHMCYKYNRYVYTTNKDRAKPLFSITTFENKHHTYLSTMTALFGGGVWCQMAAMMTLLTAGFPSLDQSVLSRNKVFGRVSSDNSLPTANRKDLSRWRLLYWSFELTTDLQVSGFCLSDTSAGSTLNSLTNMPSSFDPLFMFWNLHNFVSVWTWTCGSCWLDTHCPLSFLPAVMMLNICIFHRWRSAHAKEGHWVVFLLQQQTTTLIICPFILGSATFPSLLDSRHDDDTTTRACFFAPWQGSDRRTRRRDHPEGHVSLICYFLSLVFFLPFRASVPTCEYTRCIYKNTCTAWHLCTSGKQCTSIRGLKLKVANRLMQ